MIRLVVDPSKATPNPGAQSDFAFDWTTPLCALVSGWGGGKTWAGARKLRDQHLWNAFDDRGCLTACKSLAVAPTYSLAETVIIPALTKALDESGVAWEMIADPKLYALYLPDLSRGAWRRRSNRHDDLSLIYLRSAANAEAIAGFEVGPAWGDEAARWPNSPGDPTGDPFIQMQGRQRDMRARVRQANFTTTHEGDVTNFYEMFEVAAADRVLYRGTTMENVRNLGAGYVESLERQLGADVAKQYLQGRAVSLRGTRLYHAFDESVHMRDVPPIRFDRPLHLSIDFNFTPGMHAVIGQRADDDPGPRPSLLVAHDEVAFPDGSLARTIPDMVDQFAAWVHREHGRFRWPELWVFGDASKSTSATRGETTHQVLLERLRHHGFPVVWKIASSNPFVADRVLATNAAMLAADGSVRYRVDPKCRRLRNDFLKLRWATNGSGIDKSDGDLSHASDADGYRLWYLTGIAKPAPSGAGRVVFGR